MIIGSVTAAGYATGRYFRENHGRHVSATAVASILVATVGSNGFPSGHEAGEIPERASV